MKCDSTLPSCSTCTAVYRSECSYDADSDHRRKGTLKRDIQSLQQQNDALDVIVESLKSLPETEAFMLLQALRSDVNPGVVAASLRSNVRLPDSFAPQTPEADFAAEQLSPTAARTRFDSASMTSSRVPSVDESVHSSGTLAVERPAVWFEIPQDAEVVDHLLDLYFCWVHPMYQLLSREHFLYDMGHGRTDFCSAILVNAMLSIAYHYSDRYLARADPSNPLKVGDYFFAEAKRLLDKSESSCLTTVQALGIMSVREVSLGRDSSADQYLGRSVRMAVELGLHHSVDSNGLRSSEIEARKITFWGVFNLETYVKPFLPSQCVSLHFLQPSQSVHSICSVGKGRLSQLPRATADVQKPAISDQTKNQPWQQYGDANPSCDLNIDQPIRSMPFLEHLTRLSEIASDMVKNFYASPERYTSGHLAAAYAHYQEWYQSLDDAFPLENTSLPHVIALHMYYYACVLQ